MNKSFLTVAFAVGWHLSGCNFIADTTNRQEDAVRAAVTATCNRYEDCGEIGPDSDDAYDTRATCESEARDFWNDRWPAADCDGSINGDALDVCTNRIASTDCNSFLDQLQTVFQSCAKADVCTE